MSLFEVCIKRFDFDQRACCGPWTRIVQWLHQAQACSEARLCESPFSNTMFLLPSSFHTLGARAGGVREPLCLLLSHLWEPVGLLVWANPGLYHRAPWHFPWFLLGNACTCPVDGFVFCPGYLYCLLSLFAVSSTSLIKRTFHVG